MRIAQVEVYQFNELSEEAKEKAVNELRDINTEYSSWWDHDGLLDLSAKELKSRRITEHLTLSYKLVSFDFVRHHIRFESVEVNNDDAFRKFLRVHKRLWKKCHYAFYYPSYPSTAKTVFEIEHQEGLSFTDKEEEILDRACKIMNDKINEALVSLEESYEYLTSRRIIIETIEANKYEFTEDGKVYHY